ncbi:ornithine decarboxylase-like [Artemia franciscana]|uniref:ornithine decarboxylase n=1 Tax=Artemia franciscana TaxID=6661 RepID=A0AA88LHJ7_ARTSF|nr:hypothetical protein QYM36_000949 [Artemia franciscana]KAK2724255.1 hypothetical protein QYM36_000949 [Artemia franciscana]KAK2724256.1 hypothetical protein QYM36_000949 [Artemia franciscana]KAK2724257.1 hypothetical protein QYM36_000949 [Artemia franciscana]KAK2724258.1 hypothetical protein QYM36_000949 [Artemia franciscana]
MKPDVFNPVRTSTLDPIYVLQPGCDIINMIREIADSGVQEEAFYVLDVGDIVRKHKEWKLKLPRVTPFYAVKCNDNSTVLQVLASLGANFDCASKAEISKVTGLGVSTDRIIFANPAKQMSHIRYAAASGVRTMTYDNDTELYKIKQVHPDARMVLRIRCDAKKAQCQLGVKFGALPKDAPALIRLAHELGIDLVGISFHVGSGCQEPEVFQRAISTAKDLFEYAATLGFQMNLLDLGGGYSGNRGSSVDDVAKIVNAAIDEFFPETSGVQIIAEPGRYYVASAFTLATRIHGRREVTTEDNPLPSYMYYINDGVYGSFNCLLYDHAVCNSQLMNPKEGPLYKCSIWGPTCDGLDCVAQSVDYPLLEVGDWLVWEDMGAYTMAAAGTFNGFDVAKVFPVAFEHTWRYLKELHPLMEGGFVSDAAVFEMIRNTYKEEEKYASASHPCGLITHSAFNSAASFDTDSTSSLSDAESGVIIDSFGELCYDLEVGAH